MNYFIDQAKAQSLLLASVKGITMQMRTTEESQDWLLLGVLFVLLMLNHGLIAQVVISEFVANPAQGDQDWIELHNEGEESISLVGSYLTNSQEGTEKYQLISFDGRPLIVMPKSYILLRMGDQNDWPEGSFGFSTGLSSKGEHIGLYDSKGVLIDSLSYGKQFCGVSSGFKTSSKEKKRNLVYFPKPSPGIPNPSKAKVYQNFCQPPVFSVSSGSSLLNQKIALKSGEGRYSKIFYTLDGSVPTDSSLLYEYPFTLSKSSVVRAIVYSLGKLPSPVETEHYFIREPLSTALPSVSIAVGNWESFQNDLRKSDVEQAAHVQYYETNGDLVFETNVGLSLAGGGSRNHPQKSISLHLRAHFDSDKFFEHERLFPNKDHEHCRGFVLRNSGNAVPKTHLKDAYMQQLMAENSSVDYLDSRATSVYINGEYWGIYNLREKKCRHYYKDNHPDLKGNLTVVDGFQNRLLTGASTGFSALCQFVKENDLRGQEKYEEVCRLVDMDNFIDYQIAEIFFANTDWPINNVRAWQIESDSTNSGNKWRWLLFDLDHGFRANKVELNSIEYALGTNNFHSEDFDTALVEGTLFLRKLMKNPRFRDRFASRFVGLLNSNLSVDTMLAKLDDMVSKIEPEMLRHIERWSDDEGSVHIKSMDRWRRGIDDMREFARKRAAFLLPLVEEQLKLKGIFELHVECSEGGIIRVNELPSMDTAFSGIFFQDIPVIVKAEAKEGYEFLYWEGINNKGRETEAKVIASDSESLRIKALFKAIEP